MIAGWGNYVIVNPSRRGNFLIADSLLVELLRGHSDRHALSAAVDGLRPIEDLLSRGVDVVLQHRRPVAELVGLTLVRFQVGVRARVGELGPGRVGTLTTTRS